MQKTKEGQCHHMSDLNGHKVCSIPVQQRPGAGASEFWGAVTEQPDSGRF